MVIGLSSRLLSCALVLTFASVGLADSDIAGECRGPNLQNPKSYRTFDGKDNNLLNPNWGSSGIDLLRKAAPTYSDGISSPAGANRPNPRAVSVKLGDQGDEDIISDRRLSAMIYAWGQFVDHDLDLTPSHSPKEPLNIPVPKGDPQFDPFKTGNVFLFFNRSLWDLATGTSPAHPRQQINVITGFLDGSQIYGSSVEIADKLRTHTGGELKTTPEKFPPLNNAIYFPEGTLTMANDAHVVPDDQLYAAGDVRANENIELLALHTLFIREHNRVAKLFAQQNSSWGDEMLFQAARSYVIAELQAITYYEWLPALLGPRALRTYQGYRASTNPGIANEFSTAFFRVGHTMLGDDVEFLNNKALPVDEEIPLSEAFFNPAKFNENDIGPILKYLVTDPASEIDTKAVNSVRNFLFGPPGAGGLDLLSLNIQRAREHGLADYNTLRAAYGLSRVTSFKEISSNVETRANLQALYGNVNNIDPWMGGMAEDHVGGGSTGPVVRAALVDQFERLRDGDRFWFERIYTGQTLADLRATSLSDIIARNSDNSNLQTNVFFFRVSLSGNVYVDADRDFRRDEKEEGLSGVTVQLLNITEDPAGEVVGTTKTDAKGNYTFDQDNGLGAGLFRVRALFSKVKATRSKPLLFSRGEINLDNVNLGKR